MKIHNILIFIISTTSATNRWFAILVATLTGVIEMIASFFGFYLAEYIFFIVPLGLAFAAGSMLFIVYKELIPETHWSRV